MDHVEVHCKLYVCSNQVPRLKADNGIISRSLLVNTQNRFIENYTGEPNTYKADINLVDKFDDPKYKLAFIHFLLPYIMEMYRTNSLPVTVLKHNFEEFCIETDRWQQLKQEYLEITNDDSDRISKQGLATFYNNIYDITGRYQVSPDTARDEGIRIGLKYEKDKRLQGVKGVFVGVRIRQIMYPNDNLIQF
jgi:hypothetical protein